VQILGGRGSTSPTTIVGIKKTRVFILPHSEDRVILFSFVWIGYRRVTDGQTDGIVVAPLCIASKQCDLAVKMGDSHVYFIRSMAPALRSEPSEVQNLRKNSAVSVLRKIHKVN